LLDELNVTAEDPRAPAWRLSDLAPERQLRVVVIGAGMSGLVAAHRLLQAGIDTVVMEKNPEVGGTWFENTYPGCRVDVPNYLYSYSFAQRDDWPQYFSDQSVLLDYFRHVADAFGLRDHVELGTEVVSVELDERSHRWTVTSRRSDGSTRVTEADAVISAVGQLNQPQVPAIAGAEMFTGAAFHSARWDHDVDLAGRRVAVIGTGASAAQFIPAIAGTVSELTVFQRTPNWLVPTPEYHREVPDALTWLFRTVPTAAQWYRFWLFWRNTEGLLTAAKVDPAWPEGERSVSALNDLVREVLTGYLTTEFAGASELLPHVVPSYPPVAKRVIRDDGSWARALTADNVHLITAPIDRITPGGIRDADGVDHPADVIIYGTGFRASEFLSSLRVVGLGGQELHERWAGDARAYLGITVPGFPNLFCLYGPNTNIVVNGSIIFFSECQVDYVLQCLRLLVDSGARTMNCREEVHDRYNARIDAANASMAWGASRVNSWYKNALGRVSQNWPGSLVDYWHETRSVRAEDYDLGGVDPDRAEGGEAAPG